VADLEDPITTVLRQCEDRLRRLATQGRLTADALSAFVDLSAQVQRDSDRRTGERRAIPRASGDRRVQDPDGAAVLCAISTSVPLG
jgi:hypothetical protein